MKIKKICCEHARNLDIVHILAKLGHYHSKTTVKEAWFLSPLRFRIGKGGNCLDLIIELK